jgi:hypothetical protein
MKDLIANNKKIILVLTIFLGLAIVAGAAITGYVIFKTVFNNNQMILAASDSSGDEIDLYLLRLGQTEQEAKLIARNVKIAELLMAYQEDGHPVILGQPIPNLGGFLPNSNDLLYWYLDDDKTIINKIGVNEQEPTPIFDSESKQITGYVLDDQGTVVLMELQEGGGLRCYVYIPGENINRIGKGTNCNLSGNWKRLMVIKVENGLTSASVMDFNGENEVDVLDEEEGITSLKLSSDGSQLGYVLENNGTRQVIVIDTATGRPIFDSDEYINIAAFSFAETGNSLFLIGEDEEGLLTLYLVENGKASEVDTGYSMNAAFNQGGTMLAYVTKDDDETMRLGTYSQSGERNKNILHAGDIKFQVLRDPERILTVQTDDDELTVSSLAWNGDEAVELYNDRDVTLEQSFYLPGENLLYLILQNEDGLNLFVTPLDMENSGFTLAEEWYEISLLNRSQNGQIILWSGKEEYKDDTALYVSKVEDNSRPEMLDDDDTEIIINAVLDPKGTSAIYSVVTGKDLDELEVRQISIDGKGRYEVIYQDDLMVDVRWDLLAPFSSFMGLGSGKGELTWVEPIKGITYCPGAEKMNANSNKSGTLDAANTVCYRVNLESGQMYAFKVQSDGDTRIDLYNAFGVNKGADVDGGAGFNPLLRIQPAESGTYFAVVRMLEDSQENYSFQFIEGVGDASFDNAIQLNTNRRINGQITSSERLDFEVIDYYTYGKVYYFEGSAGDRITIDVYGPSIGSEMDPVVTLYSSELVNLGSDDDGGDGYDSRLTYTLPSNGRYYVLVENVGKHYGSANNFYYQVQLTKR